MTENTITCDEVHEHICNNLDEELNSPHCKAIRAHLNKCHDCSDYLKSVKKTIHLYKEYPSPRLSDSKKEMIEDHIKKIIGL
jgi:predicted anti-sigma-YlaC factor YlaD